MTKPVTLLPCPFCAGEAIRCGNNEINPRHWIMCRDCHACPGGDVPDLATAEAAWNTRGFSPATIAASVIAEMVTQPPAQNVDGVDIPRLPVGTPVTKVLGYPFPGTVVSTFHTLSGQERFVVEATGEAYRGMLHIFNGDQLRAAASEGSADE